MPLQELLASLVPGERFGFRLRIKPSWSGRVYGTFSIGTPFIAAALLFCTTSGALFLRLLTLNLEQPGLETERATLARCAGHGLASREVLLPVHARKLEQSGEELFGLSYRLRTILGLHEPSASAGIGRMDGEYGSDAPAGGARGRLTKVTGDIALLSAYFDRLTVELSAQEEQLRYTPSVAPLFQVEFVPTSSFGPRVSPFTRLPEYHRGQDLAASLGSKIVATADGVVIKAEHTDDGRMGRYVVIDHSGRFQTYYGHCERIFVEEGETVHRHQIIAEVGNTGRSTGPHVHYEVRVGGEPRDPRQFLVFDPHFNSEEQLRVE